MVGLVEIFVTVIGISIYEKQLLKIYIKNAENVTYSPQIGYSVVELSRFRFFDTSPTLSYCSKTALLCGFEKCLYVTPLFNRPVVSRLLEDAKTGKINLIIVKDLSRFGRNYIQVGQYIDCIFPTYNIRFIALSDNVDTANKDTTAMDMMPIVNLFNE